MNRLRASGDKSFEELIARLMSKLSGERIRRCAAGAQEGVDALSDTPFGIEDKRYGTSPLDSRDLLGGLSQAAQKHPELQLWILVSTRGLKALDAHDLREAGARQGISVLILDPQDTTSELGNVSPLEALAATDIETTVACVTDRAWQSSNAKGPLPEPQVIRRELKAIRRKPGFQQWEDRLRQELLDLPTWRHLVRRQNGSLLKSIQVDAEVEFGVPFDPSKAVPRTAEARLTEWWGRANCAASPAVGVVTGDRYDGKTWLLYRWLSENLPALSVPVFFISSSRGKEARGDIGTLVLRLAGTALGSFSRHAGAIIERQRTRAGIGPWCLVVLDGANEYLTDSHALSSLIRWAAPIPMEATPEYPHLGRDDNRETLLEPKERSPSLLVSVRAREFDDDASWLGGRTIERLPLGAFDDAELAEALRRRNVGPDVLETIPPSARAMVARPRFLDLLLRYRTEVGRFAGSTESVLYYLDASDKVRSRAAIGTGTAGADTFKEVLLELAQSWQKDRRLSRAAVRQKVTQLTDQVNAAVMELHSEGVVRSEPDGMLTLDPARLALGMGLFIRRELFHPAGKRLDEVLADILDPNADDDEKIRWLRAATTVSLLANDGRDRPEVLDSLLSRWFSARNFSRQDVEEVRSLALLLVEPTLRLVPKLLTRPDAHALVAVAQLVIEKGLDDAKAAITAAVCQWFRTVPVGARWYLGGKEEKPEEVQQVLGDPSLRDLDLVLGHATVGEATRHLQRFGLSLASRCPGLIAPRDILALLASRKAVSGYLTAGEVFAVRAALETSEHLAYEREVDGCERTPGSRRTLLVRSLIDLAERRDLADVAARLPKPERGVWRSDALEAEEFRTLTSSAVPAGTDVLKVFRRARELALEPEAPRPSRAWRAALARAALAQFAPPTRLAAHQCSTIDDSDHESLEPALAAWAPTAAAAIARAVLDDIPRRIRANEQSWSWDLEGHAALVDTAARTRLLRAVRQGSKNHDRRHALERGYLCAMAGASAKDRLRLLLSHGFGFEWTGYYEVLGAAADESLRSLALAATRTERRGLRLRRARYLLGYLNADLCEADVRRLAVDASRRGPDEDAARFLLLRCRVPSDIPASAFGRFVSAAKDAVTAAWQYAGFLNRRRHPDNRKSLWVTRALAAPLTARMAVPRSDDSDDVVVRTAIAALQEQFLGELQALSSEGGRKSVDETRQLPESIVGELDAEAFEAWIDAILAAPRYSRLFSNGLLPPVVRRAFRRAHPKTHRLWAVVYPFKRDAASQGNRIVVSGGLDWALAAIHEAAANDEIAAELLRALLQDCRSDSELVQVAMAARVTCDRRLIAAVSEGLHSPRERDRARARFIAGWLPPDAGFREALAASDPSVWVERIGATAQRRLDHEVFARHWLERFLVSRSRHERWAAGRLFLACSDAATAFWAHGLISASTAPSSVRGEAHLLLRQLKKKWDDSDLKDQYLECPVRELADVVEPWRGRLDWDQIDLMRDPPGAAS